jgi:hypothetical protein
MLSPSSSASRVGQLAAGGRNVARVDGWLAEEAAAGADNEDDDDLRLCERPAAVAVGLKGPLGSAVLPPAVDEPCVNEDMSVLVECRRQGPSCGLVPAAVATPPTEDAPSPPPREPLTSSSLTTRTPIRLRWTWPCSGGARV